MMINAINAKDFYKDGHAFMYPEGTQDIVANFTARSASYANMLPDFDNKTVFYGLQGVCQTLLIDLWNKTFFHVPKEIAVAKYVRRVSSGIGPEYADAAHIEALWDIGYLPIVIRAVPEGSRVNIKVPMFTVRISKKHRKDAKPMGWLVTYLETQLSSEMWKKITVATIAYEYRRLLDKYAAETGSAPEFVDWQGHDFSARGMTGIHDAAENGSGHLLSFLGTDTVSAIDYLEDYYFGADTFVGGSVVATEHSCACLNIAQYNPELKGELNLEAEEQYLSRMLDKYPSGILSYVADTNDYFGVLTRILPNLKDKILARVPNAIGLAKLVIRPDSGDPKSIVCGQDTGLYYTGNFINAESFEDFKEQARVFLQSTCYSEDREFHSMTFYWNQQSSTYRINGSLEDSFEIEEVKEINTPELIGSLDILWQIFGGTINAAGYKVLNPRIGLIYGDSITLERASAILANMKLKGYASENIVFGIGSFTYNMITRDTFGHAYKATFAMVDDVPFTMQKNPKTDNGVKKSAKGLIRVVKINGNFYVEDGCTEEEAKTGELKIVFENGKLINPDTLAGIRQRLKVG